MELAFLLITIIVSSVMAGLVTYKINEFERKPMLHW